MPPKIKSLPPWRCPYCNAFNTSSGGGSELTHKRGDRHTIKRHYRCYTGTCQRSWVAVFVMVDKVDGETGKVLEEYGDV